MTQPLSPEQAMRANALALLATLLVLIATPVPASLIIAMVLIYALAYLMANRRTVRLSALDYLIILILLSYLIGRLAPFVMDDFTARYLSAPLHVAASIPIYLMLRHASSQVRFDLAHYRACLEWGAALGAMGGGVVAAYQAWWLGVPRADGFMFYLNFAYLACSLMLICLALLRNSQRRWLLLAGILGAMLAILLSATRGVLLAVPLLLLLVLLLNIDRVGWKKLALASVGTLLLSLIAYATIPMVQERVDFTIEELRHIQQGQIEDAISSGGRVQLWTAATEAFMERPLVGLTYPEREAQIRDLVEQGRLTDWMLGIDRGHAHSQYFEAMATGGIIGIIALGGYLFSPLVAFLWLHYRQPENPFAQAGALFTIGFVVYCLTEVAIQKEMIAAWYGYIQVNLMVLALLWDKQLWEKQLWEKQRPRSLSKSGNPEPLAPA